jgi:hypothetical protein
MNGPTIAQVDAAVRAVLAGLGIGREAYESDVEVFAGRLLTLRHAEGLAPGVREIRVAPGTVVTPLARDHLKRQGVGLRVVSEGEARGSRREGEWGFAIEAESGMVAALRRALLAGTDPWRMIDGGPIAAARWVARSAERGAVVVTDEASVACWMANGVEGVRAATVAEAGAVSRAIRRLGANLLVIEPAGQTIFSMRHLVATFRRGGAPTPPEGLGRGPDRRAVGHEDRRGDRPGHAVAGPPEPTQRAVVDHAAHAARGPDRGLARAW